MKNWRYMNRGELENLIDRIDDLHSAYEDVLDDTIELDMNVFEITQDPNDDPDKPGGLGCDYEINFSPIPKIVYGLNDISNRLKSYRDDKFPMEDEDDEY